jgi:hypothetical protein
MSAKAGAVEPTSRPSLPVVRVAIGMSVHDLRAGSTYPFAPLKGTQVDTDSNVVSISAPYTLELHNGSEVLTLKELGGENYFTASMTIDGKVDHIGVHDREHCAYVNRCGSTQSMANLDNTQRC